MERRDTNSREVDTSESVEVEEFKLLNSEPHDAYTDRPVEEQAEDYGKEA